MRLQFNRFYSPDDAPGASAGELGKEEMIELLGEEDEKPEVLDLPKDKKDKKETKEGEEAEEEDGKETEEPEEVDELKEIEEELEGPKEEDLELMTPVRRKEILKVFPDLFKKFPYLERAYYRDQQFTEILPTIQDARAAAEKAQILDRVEQQVMSGDISNVLAAAKSEDQEAFLKIVDNYLPTLKHVDQQAYYHVVGNVVKDTIIAMVREARALGEQGTPLQAAANVLNQFVFGSQNFTPPQQLARQVKPEEQGREQQIQHQEQQRVYQIFESTRETLQTKADNVLKSTIDQHIDPKQTMTDYVRKNAVREAFETLEGLMVRDTRFRGLLDRLWEKAFEKQFDKESTDRIKSAYLSKAKTLLPSVIKKARNDALKGLGRRVNNEEAEDEEVETPARKGPVTPGKSASPSSGKIRKPADIPKGMSTLDVLNSD